MLIPLWFLIALSAAFAITLIVNHKNIPCHRLPERTFKWMHGKPYAICARCFAVYVSFTLLPLWWTLLDYFVPYRVTVYPFVFLIGVLCIIPLFIDGITQAKKKRKSNNFLRVITGLLFGLGVYICIYAVVNFFVGGAVCLYLLR